MGNDLDFERKRISFEEFAKSLQIRGRPFIENEQMLRRRGGSYHNDLVDMMWKCYMEGIISIQQRV